MNLTVAPTAVTHGDVIDTKNGKITVHKIVRRGGRHIFHEYGGRFHIARHDSRVTVIK